MQREYIVEEAKRQARLAEAKRIADWDAYDQNTAADFFEPEWMFGVKEGFDIVISNPPYIRHEKILPQKPALQKYFDDFFSSTADISVYFYKRAAEFLRDDGILTYISTNRFMLRKYGKNVRQFLISEMSLKSFLDFGGLSVFNAAVNTCIVIFIKHIPSEHHSCQVVTLKVESDDFKVRQTFQTQAFSMEYSELSSEGWTFASPAILGLINKLKDIGTPLGQLTQNKVYSGVYTVNEYIIDVSTRNSLISEDSNCSNLIKPTLRGRDTRKWKAKWANLYMIMLESSANRVWPWTDANNEVEAEHIFAKTYPSIYNYLQLFRERLLSRRVQGKYYWELGACAYYAEFEKPKIIYPDVAKSIYIYVMTKLG